MLISGQKVSEPTQVSFKEAVDVLLGTFDLVLLEHLLHKSAVGPAGKGQGLSGLRQAKNFIKGRGKARTPAPWVRMRVPSISNRTSRNMGGGTSHWVSGWSTSDGEQPVQGASLTLSWLLGRVGKMTRGIVCIIGMLVLSLGCQSDNSGRRPENRTTASGSLGEVLSTIPEERGLGVWS